MFKKQLKKLLIVIRIMRLACSNDRLEDSWLNARSRGIDPGEAAAVEFGILIL